MDRRDFGKVVGGIALGAAGLNTLTQDASAVSVSTYGYRIPDESVQTPTPVNGVHINVSGAYSWETQTTPTRVTLRLTVTYAGETEQIAAMRVPGQLSPSDSGEFDFQANLLSHSQITAPALTPTEVGDTKSLTFDSALTLTVAGDSGKLGSHTVEDTATIDVMMEQATVKATISADGSIEVSTKTPA